MGDAADPDVGIIPGGPIDQAQQLKKQADDAVAGASAAVQGIADQAEQVTKPKIPTFTGAPTQAIGSMVGGKRTHSRKNKKM
jgi:hypothetical protein